MLSAIQISQLSCLGRPGPFDLPLGSSQRDVTAIAVRILEDCILCLVGYNMLQLHSITVARGKSRHAA